LFIGPLQLSYLLLELLIGLAEGLIVLAQVVLHAPQLVVPRNRSPNREDLSEHEQSHQGQSTDVDPQLQDIVASHGGGQCQQQDGGRDQQIRQQGAPQQGRGEHVLRFWLGRNQG